MTSDIERTLDIGKRIFEYFKPPSSPIIKDFRFNEKDFN
jgi:hypothetical protein